MTTGGHPGGDGVVVDRLASTPRDCVPDRAAPTWSRVAAWLVVACVVPSAMWRLAVGVGIDLGWSDRQLERQHIPGEGTVYVVGLSALSLAAAGLTLMLVRAGADRVPSWLPVVGGRRLPPPVVVGVALLGAAVVAWFCVLSVRHWDRVSGFADQPDSGWQLVMIACYAPALAWAPLLVVVTADYSRRYRR